ncbi:MAG: hypothetical protein EA365_02755 [Gloeocapsa sp. DLM2.Bin57]|nr:MAG: hypothetical protein EA365_02755 [Gloeocapsa sp. DLM2.Bin57]
MAIISGASISDWFNSGFIQEVIATPAGGTAITTATTANNTQAAIKAVFDAPSRDNLISPTAPVTVTVTDPNNPTIQQSFGAGPTFGIGVNTPAVIGLTGITTAPEEIGYYPQATGNKADSLTIKLNQDFTTGGTDSGFVFSYFFSEEFSGGAEIMNYQLKDDGSIVRSGTITAQNTGIFDWQNTPNAQNAGVFHYKFNTPTNPIVFDEVVITAGNGLNNDGTDALLEAIIATQVIPAPPDEDLEQRNMRIDFINNNNGCDCGTIPNDIREQRWYNDYYPVVIYGQRAGNRSLNPNDILDRDTIRLGITRDDAVNDTNTIKPDPQGLANNNFGIRFRERDINLDGVMDMILYFKKSEANPLRNLPGFNGSIFVAAEGTIGNNDFLFVGTDTVA